MLRRSPHWCRTPFPQDRAAIQSRYIITPSAVCPYARLHSPNEFPPQSACTLGALAPMLMAHTAPSDEGGLSKGRGKPQGEQHSLGCCCAVKKCLSHTYATAQQCAEPTLTGHHHAGHFMTSVQDSEVCNAGNGSNWTLGGHVECDASVMAGDGAFGAVGAVSGEFDTAHPCHNPSRHLLLLYNSCTAQESACGVMSVCCLFIPAVRLL